MLVSIRKFEQKDINKKIIWINDPNNNEFLHYDLPLVYEKTKNWFDNVKCRSDRFDAVIECDGIPCGLIGLLNIDQKNRKAEFYISMGEHSYKGKGIATKAGLLLLDYAFNHINLNRVYLFTEVKNAIAQKLFDKLGFIKEGCVIQDLFSKGVFVNRYIYGICKSSYDTHGELQ